MQQDETTPVGPLTVSLISSGRFFLGPCVDSTEARLMIMLFCTYMRCVLFEVPEWNFIKKCVCGGVSFHHLPFISSLLQNSCCDFPRISEVIGKASGSISSTNGLV